MYWKASGTTGRTVYEHTYLYNRLWGHPIYPVGQTYESPGNGSLMLFRRFAASYGGLAPSWWDWQETTGGGGGALRPTPPLPPPPRPPPDLPPPPLNPTPPPHPAPP